MISWSQRPLPDNTQQSQQTNIHAPVGFEPTISVGARPQTHALDRATTGTGDTEHYRTESAVVLIDVNISGTKNEGDVQGKNICNERN